MARKPKETPHLRLRIEPSLLARLEKSREKTGRTLTGEIVHRLEQSFTKDDTREYLERQAELIAEKLLAAKSWGNAMTEAIAGSKTGDGK